MLLFQSLLDHLYLLKYYYNGLSTKLLREEGRKLKYNCDFGMIVQDGVLL